MPRIVLVLLVCVAAGCLEITPIERTIEATKLATSCDDGCPQPPYCPGLELHYTIGDAISDVLLAYCAFHPEIPNCDTFYINTICPTPTYCTLVLCGDQLDVVAKCITATTSLGAIPNECLAFLSKILDDANPSGPIAKPSHHLP